LRSAMYDSSWTTIYINTDWFVSQNTKHGLPKQFGYQG
jgi:hypothetical protein